MKIITSSDPSSYKSVQDDKGLKKRSLFSRTLGRFYTTLAYIYNVRFSDQAHTTEFRVDQRLGPSRHHVVHYATVLGRIPAFARSRVHHFDIAPGNHPQAGGGSYTGKTLHIELTYAQGTEAQGSLEEMLMHEGIHVSQQDWQKDTRWTNAARRDGVYISNYAAGNPNREDVAESLVPWYALRCRSSTLSREDLMTICSSIPNRIAYFDYKMATGELGC